MNISWAGKSTLFKAPFGPIFRALGGVPIDRQKAGNQAENIAKTITDAERLIPVALGGKKFVSFPMGVRFPVDSNMTKAYEKAVLNSTSHDRAMAAARIFDGLLEKADDVNAPLYDEHTAAFPLLGLVAREKLEVGMDIRADVKSSFWVKRERYLKAGFTSAKGYAKGGEVSTISAGMFDLSTMMNQN